MTLKLGLELSLHCDFKCHLQGPYFRLGVVMNDESCLDRWGGFRWTTSIYEKHRYQ